MNPQQPSPESQSVAEVLTGTKKSLNDVLGSISTLNSDIEARMVNGTQANLPSDWHDAWANLASPIILSFQMAAMMDKGELSDEDKKFFLDKADELLKAIQSVDKNNRAGEEPKLQKIVDEMKMKAEGVVVK
ncbi:MAG: hypothetical protein V4509_03625 [Patescibacteria group bacterium]